MFKFRNHTPKRRPITRIVSKCTYHKRDLKIDFLSRCGYCNAPDSWRREYYTIDHFIPVSILTIYSDTEYCNLVYACSSCNRAKWDKWPTQIESKPNDNDIGFVDPCDDNYNSHFVRNDDGSICYTTELGKWMYFELELHKPQHKIIWNIERTKVDINRIKSLLYHNKLDQRLKDVLLRTYIEFDEYISQLQESS